MAHCSPCKSRLGSGGKVKNGTLTRSSFVMGSGAEDGEDLEAVGAYETVGALGSGARGATVSQQILRSTWIPAHTSPVAPAGILPWALYTGGRFAYVYTARGVTRRRVVAARNAGPLGLEIRVGGTVRGASRFGTGCMREFGSGQQLSELALYHGFNADDCQVIYYGGQAYMCCQGGCVPLPITSGERDLFLPHMFTAARRPRRRRR